MIKNKTRTVILAVALIVWMVVIFCFSAQPSDDSQNTSDIFTLFAQKIFYPNFNELSNGEQLVIMAKLSFLVRKTAHFTAYFILGVLSYFNIIFSKRLALGFKGIIAFIFCVLYSISDEIHQYFVPGRSCEFRDVCIDSSGALLSILIIFLIFRLSKRLYNSIKG